MAVKLREKKLSANRYSLYLDIWHKNKREYVFLKLFIDKGKNITPEQREKNNQNKELAEKIRADKESVIDYKRFGKVSPVLDKACFIKFSEAYYNSKPSNQQAFYRGTIEHFKKSIGADSIQANQITPDVVKEFKNYLKDCKELSKTTPYSYFARFKTLLNYATEKGLFAVSPASNVKNEKKPQTNKPYLTADELQILFNTSCSKPEIKRAFLFACNTGLRHVDLSRLIWASVVDETIEIVQQKTDKPLKVNLNSNAKILIGERGNPASNVFKLPQVSQCNVALKQWAKDAKIKKNLSFHISRHSFATNLLINGQGIATIADLLGHTSLAHVQIYAKVVEQLKSKAVDSLPEMKINTPEQ